MKFTPIHLVILLLSLTLITVGYWYYENKAIILQVKEVVKLREEKLTNLSSGATWQEMLSFLTLDSMGKCEDIFKLAANKQYTTDIAPYYKLVESHDKMIKEIAASRNISKGCVTGYSARYKEETYVMLNLVRLPFVKTVCETGFNGGHSALLWLSAKHSAKVYSFDLGDFRCAKPMAEHLIKSYPGRLKVTWGDSIKTLPQFISDNPHVKCDLLIIDGGHTYTIARQDRENFKKMVRGVENIVFLDNYPDRRLTKYHLGRAWEEAIRSGDVHEYYRCNYDKYKQGFTFGRFIIDR